MVAVYLAYEGLAAIVRAFGESLALRPLFLEVAYVLGLLAVAWVAAGWPGPLPQWGGWLFVLGTVLFSGSLYLLALSGVRWLGDVTPLAFDTAHLTDVGSELLGRLLRDHPTARGKPL